MPREKPKRISRVHKSLPQCKACLLCDDVMIDALTSKPSLMGLFNACPVPSFPGRTRPFAVFLQLIDAVGRFDIRLSIADLSTGDELGEVTSPPVEITERLLPTNVVIRIPPVTVEHDGAYDLVVLADGEEIDRQQFWVVTEPG